MTVSFQGTARRAVVAPVEGVVDHRRTWARTRRESRSSGRVGLGPRRPGSRTAASSQSTSPTDRLGVRVDQQLVRVEPMARSRRPRARARGSRSSWPGRDVGQVAVPDVDPSAPAGECALARCRPRRTGPARRGSAFSLKSAKLTPCPSQVAPSGYGRPGQTLSATGHPGAQRRPSADRFSPPQGTQPAPSALAGRAASRPHVPGGEPFDRRQRRRVARLVRTS